MSKSPMTAPLPKLLILWPDGSLPELGLAAGERVWVLGPQDAEPVRAVRQLEGVSYADLDRLLRQGRLQPCDAQFDLATPTLREWARTMSIVTAVDRAGRAHLTLLR